jgi:spermidine synthase
VSRESRAAAAAFVAAAVTLFTQVLVHRLVSAKLLNNYAFLVISLTMLGFAASAVALTRWLPQVMARLDDFLVVFAALFALSLPLASWAFCRAPAPAPTWHRLEFVIAFFQTTPAALLFAVPFGFTGAILGALLAAPDLPTRRIYCWDLVGSGLGAVCVITAISRLGVEWALLVGAATLLLANALLFPPRRRSVAALALVAAAGLGAAGFARARLFDIRPMPSLDWVARMSPPYGLEYVAWDPTARIEVSRVPPPDPATMNYPCLIGDDRAFHQRFDRMLTQNNYAFTYAVRYDGDPASLRGIEQTIYSAAYQAASVERPRVLVIGVGGGFDILTALYFRAAEVTGVEINAATVSIIRAVYRDYFAPWATDPRVRIVLAEGRHYLESTAGRYDVLQLSGVDSYSGTSGAAHVFSESYLYTAEAFDLYLSHLSEQGILNMMRLEFRPEREMLRALTTAVGALRRAGVKEPSRHVVTITSARRNFTAMLVKKTPFQAAELARLASWAEANPHLWVSAAPGFQPRWPNMYAAFLGLGDAKREAAFVRAYPWDISPATDDRPFFFKYSFWRHVFSSYRLVQAEVPALEYSLLLLLGLVGLAAVACIQVPLRYLTARQARAPQAFRHGVVFAGIGIGYLAIELALLQKFGLFLGHPNYALSVVLAALLVATGLGSMASARLVQALGGIRFVGYALSGLLLLDVLVLLPRLTALLRWPFISRAAVVSALVLPVGMLLGTYLPTALDGLKRTAPQFVPWAWGINGIFSVLAPLLAVGVSATWGMNALLLASIPVYLVVGAAFPGEAGRAEP